MKGKAFLPAGRELAQGKTEAHWRAAAGRAYYALLLEARDALVRWGISRPPKDQVHAFVRLRFLYSKDADLKQVGNALERLGQLRNRADYQLAPSNEFANAIRVQQALADTDSNL